MNCRVVLLGAIAGLACGARADYYVAPGGDDDTHDGTSWGQAWKTISNAVAQIPDGQVLVLSNGLYELDAQVTLDKAITLTNAAGDPDQVVVSGKGAVRCFCLNHPEAVLDGITVSNGAAESASPNASYGGGAHVIAGCIVRCVFRDNRSSPVDTTGYGGGVSLFDGGRLYDSRLENNLAGGASGRGGGVYANSNSVVSNCVIVGNTAGNTGGGIHLGGISGVEGTARVDRCQVWANQAGNYGGGIHAYAGEIVNSTCLWNTVSAGGAQGGGLYLSSSVVSNCAIVSNVVPELSGLGGGAYIIGNTLLLDSTLAGNSATNGAGIYARPTLSSLVERCVLADNVASNNGGGIYPYNDKGDLTVLDSTIRGNTAGGGAGVYFPPYPYTCILKRCVLADNSARGNGGGLYTDATNYLVSHCRFTGNTAGSYGGAIRLTATQWPTNGVFRNCLIARNQANQYGGGVYLQYGRFDGCTIVSNIGSSRCGGLYFTGDNRIGVVNDCVLYGNSGAMGNNYRPPTSGTVSFNYSCTTPTNPSTIYQFTGCTDADPLLAYDPAGPAYRLQAGSPCVNTGSNLAWMAGETDLDGHARLDRFSGKPDMGAWEFSPAGTLLMVR